MYYIRYIHVNYKSESCMLLGDNVRGVVTYDNSYVYVPSMVQNTGGLPTQYIQRACVVSTDNALTVCNNLYDIYLLVYPSPYYNEISSMDVHTSVDEWVLFNNNKENIVSCYTNTDKNECIDFLSCYDTLNTSFAIPNQISGKKRNLLYRKQPPRKYHNVVPPNLSCETVCMRTGGVVMPSYKHDIISIAGSFVLIIVFTLLL